jgi:predicted Rossmann fold nucleotide-binding protein DprA/Smf involved in DNA uptake
MSESLVITDPRYPVRLRERMGEKAPPRLHLHGHAGLLVLHKTALFCSARCPGSAILRAYDQAAHWRDTDRCVISGFHSTVEKESLRILLRGASPVIVCPARGLPKRIPPEWRHPLKEHRMLILSIFPPEESRVTTALAIRRNEFVAAIADEVWFAHVEESSRTSVLAAMAHRMGIPIAQTPESQAS